MADSDSVVVLARETRAMLDMHMRNCNGSAERTANDIKSIREALHLDRTDFKAGITRIHDKLDNFMKAFISALVGGVIILIGAVATIFWQMIAP